MIGNREISNEDRKKMFEEYNARKNELPSIISDTIDLIKKLNEGTQAGFRRQNLPSLLGKYFLDMKRVFETYMILLKPGAPAYVVVGNNHTIAGGKRVDIETDIYLMLLGESVGLNVHDELPMEMLTSRDIFKKNTGTAETILSFSKPQ
jgi:site-specific DNA-methyltransferase (cytosine-N4-specific)